MKTAGIVLAAGAATRYRGSGGRLETKLVEPVAGKPMLCQAVRAALDGGLDPVVVVTGHARAAVEAAVAGWPVVVAHNTDFSAGLSTSLRVGLGCIGGDVEAVVILLGDMPRIEGSLVARLVAAAHRAPQVQAVVPVAGGVRGNPVLLRRSLFAAASRMTGDQGARRLLRDPAISVMDVEVVGFDTLFDIDDAHGFVAT